MRKSSPTIPCINGFKGAIDTYMHSLSDLFVDVQPAISMAARMAVANFLILSFMERAWHPEHYFKAKILNMDECGFPPREFYIYK